MFSKGFQAFAPHVFQKEREKTLPTLSPIPPITKYNYFPREMNYENVIFFLWILLLGARRRPWACAGGAFSRVFEVPAGLVCLLCLEPHSGCYVGSPTWNLTLVIPIGPYWLCKLILTLITLALMNLADVKASLGRGYYVGNSDWH